MGKKIGEKMCGSNLLQGIIPSTGPHQTASLCRLLLGLCDTGGRKIRRKKCEDRMKRR